MFEATTKRLEIIAGLVVVCVIASACGSSSTSSDEKAQSALPSTPAQSPVSEDMIEVPPGSFRESRSCNGADSSARTDRPYRIDRRVVSCADYTACVKAHRCKSFGDKTCFGKIANVPRAEAATYCEWRGAALPNSGQWQKAAGADRDPFKGVTDRSYEAMCEARQAPSNKGRCLYHSRLGLEIEMLQGLLDGEWTSDLSCEADEDGVHQPQAVGLNNSLDSLVTPKFEFQQFRCLRML